MWGAVIGNHPRLMVTSFWAPKYSMGSRQRRPRSGRLGWWSIDLVKRVTPNILWRGSIQSSPGSYWLQKDLEAVPYSNCAGLPLHIPLGPRVVILQFEDPQAILATVMMGLILNHSSKKRHIIWKEERK